jgi:hypothetical protein
MQSNHKMKPILVIVVMKKVVSLIRLSIDVYFFLLDQLTSSESGVDGDDENDSGSDAERRGLLRSFRICLLVIKI